VHFVLGICTNYGLLINPCWVKKQQMCFSILTRHFLPHINIFFLSLWSVLLAGLEESSQRRPRGRNHLRSPDETQGTTPTWALIHVLTFSKSSCLSFGESFSNPYGWTTAPRINVPTSILSFCSVFGRKIVHPNRISLTAVFLISNSWSGNLEK